MGRPAPLSWPPEIQPLTKKKEKEKSKEEERSKDEERPKDWADQVEEEESKDVDSDVNSDVDSDSEEEEEKVFSKEVVDRVREVGERS